jgi:hypothetical protein
MRKGKLLGQGRTAEVYAWGDFQVLKLFFTTWPVEWIHQEARVARVVHEAGLASPAAGDLIEVEGRLGIVYERIDGPSMLEEVARHPWRIVSLAHQFADLHLAMHRRVEMDPVNGGPRPSRHYRPAHPVTCGLFCPRPRDSMLQKRARPGERVGQPRL